MTQAAWTAVLDQFGKGKELIGISLGWPADEQWALDLGPAGSHH